MKNTSIRLLKMIALIAPVLLFVFVTQDYFFRSLDHNAERVRRFYQEEENSIDVVILGASDVHAGYAPALAYEKYGFTSYMFSIDSNPGSLYKYEVQEILSTQNPSVLIVEVFGFMSPDPEFQSEDTRLRTFLENIPSSLNKLDVMWQRHNEDFLSYLFPFIKYHGNWSAGDLMERYTWRKYTQGGPAVLKGMISFTNMEQSIPDPVIPELELNSEQIVIAEDLLIDFLNYCKEANIPNVIFTRFPSKSYGQNALKVSQVEQIVTEYGYPFLDVQKEFDQIGLDYQNDFFNPEHLNIYGQEKLTDYLGSYLVKNYHIEPVPQSAENMHHWEICVDYYHTFRRYAMEMIDNGEGVLACEMYGFFDRMMEWQNENNA